METRMIIRKYLERLAYALGFWLGAFAFLFVGAYKLSQKCMWTAEDAMKGKLDNPKPERSKPYVDPRIRTAADHFAFGPMCQVHPDAKITNRDQMFNAMANAAYQTASHVREATGQTPTTVDVEARYVTLNRVLQIKTKLALKDMPGMLNVSIPEDEQDNWRRFGFAMKCFLN